tara:strand:+ start:1382 stop:2014 length:633 start_codon:yes stop_codon:yes gene_type:complete
MKKYYDILGLDEGASKEQIEKQYKKLSKEFDPKNNDNQDFFKEEFKKIQEAYKVLIKDAILAKTTSKSNNSESTSSEKEDKSPKQPRANSTNNKNELPIKANNKKRDLVFGILMTFIGLGIWGIFLQNMGFFVPNEDYAQKVKVVNTVDVSGEVDVDGSVRVDGGYMNVDIDNTVDINIARINGHNWFYRKSGDSYENGRKLYYRLPVSD